MSPKHQCRCCGALSLDEAPLGTFEMCSNCGWEDDPVQSSDPDVAGGANGCSMKAFRQHMIVEQAKHELWRVQQHGSPVIRIHVAGSTIDASLDEAAAWMSDAVSSGGHLEIRPTCDHPPEVIVSIDRSVHD